MRLAPDPRTDEPVGQLQEVDPLSPESRYQDALRALDVIDAFVMAHAELEFKEFFRRLRSLGAWHDLLANLDALSSRATAERTQLA